MRTGASPLPSRPFDWSTLVFIPCRTPNRAKATATCRSINGVRSGLRQMSEQIKREVFHVVNLGRLQAISNSQAYLIDWRKQMVARSPLCRRTVPDRPGLLGRRAGCAPRSKNFVACDCQIARTFEARRNLSNASQHRSAAWPDRSSSSAVICAVARPPE